MRKALLFFAGLYGIMSSLPGMAQGRVEEAEEKVHSIFIYNFTRYINWPDDYNRGDFVIGVLGETELIGELNKMAREKKINNRKIVVKKYSEVEQIDKKCHILFINSASSSVLSSVLNKTKNSSTLVITRKDGLGRAGSLVNFVLLNGKFRFELNMQALEAHQLKCTQQLKMLAIVL